MEPTDFYLFVLPMGVLVAILVSLVFYYARIREKSERKLKKLMRTYVIDRLKQERLFANQFEELEAQLRNKSIDQDTYARLRRLLEIASAKRREEARAQLEPGV